MKFELLIFIFVQSVLSDTVPKNEKYAFAWSWTWTTVPTNDGSRNINENQEQINLDSQRPKIKNENYILKAVDPNGPVNPQENSYIERSSDSLINDPNYQTLLDFQQRYMKVVRSPEYQNQQQQQVKDSLYYIPTNTVISPEEQRIQSDNVRAQKTIWYPIVQPNINDLNTPIHTIVYPNPNTGTQKSNVQSNNTPVIAYAASNIIIPPNLQTFLQNPYGYLNSVAYTQV